MFTEICTGIFEKDGILYDDSMRPIEICLHDGEGDGFLSRSSVTGMGWEVDPYTDEIALPSSCLRLDLETNIRASGDPLSESQVESILDFFKKEIEENDRKTRAWMYEEYGIEI